MNSSSWRGRWSFGLIVLLSLVLIVLADWLFYRRAVGWALGAYAGFLVMLLAWRGGRMLLGAPGLVLVAGGLGLAGAMVEHPGGVPVVLGALCLGTLAMTGRGGWTGGTPRERCSG